MKGKDRTWPTFAQELLTARAELQLGAEVGLALRAERRRLGLSQRAYAAYRGWTASTVARAETTAAEMKLGDVQAALDGTSFMLCLCHRPAEPEPEPPEGVAGRPNRAAGAGPDCAESRTPGSGTPAPRGPTALPAAPPPVTEPRPVHPTFWPRAELVARVRGGNRRFPGHHVASQVSSGPPWWWNAESTTWGTVPPDWYAPRFTQRPPAS